MTTERTELKYLTPSVVKMLDERNDLLIDLYDLALAEHVGPMRQPCDPDIECSNCTLLLGAAEELGLPDPFGPLPPEAQPGQGEG